MTSYVLLDRDGTLIKSIPYLLDPNKVELLPTVIEALMLLKANGFRFGVITNQSLVSRGFGTLGEVNLVNSRLEDILQECGLYFDFIFICPHHPMANCSCRKPRIGLGEEAIKHFSLDVKTSFMIGDQLSDIEFGYLLGCRTIEINYARSAKSTADFFAADMISAARWIIGGEF